MAELTDSQILEGDLEKVGLPQVLKTLAARQSTGILTVQGEDDIVAVSCLQGHIVTADSLNQTQEESLGELLVRQKLIPKGDFDAVVMEHQGSGGNLGDLLVSRGLITREKLLECLRLQTYHLMLQILTWRRGEFKFYGGDEVSYEKGVTPISVEEMLIRALAELGEKSGVGGEVPRLDAIYRKVPPRGDLKVLGRDGTGDGPGIWITEAQEAFLERMDGQTSAYDIARALGAGRFKTLFSLHQLGQQDLIELIQVAHRPEPAAAPARPTAPAGAATAQSAAPGTLAPPAPAPAHREQRHPPGQRPSRLEPPAPARPRRRATEDEMEGTISVVPSTPRPWIGAAVAALLASAMGLALAIRPVAYLSPFPWQGSQAAAVERQARQTLFHKIDRAIGIYYLMEFKFPETLDQLVERELLSSTDLSTPFYQRLRFSSTEESYLLELVENGEAVESRKGGVKGNFVADQDYFPPEDVRNPLVLLD